MGKFSYKVRDREDRVLLGTMDAVTADEVLEKLTQKSLLPIQVKELTGDELQVRPSISDILRESFKTRQNRVPYKTVVFFTRQLATMVGQGVPLSRALDQLAKGEKDVFKGIIIQVADDLSSGFTFSEALARHPGAFNSMYVSVAHSGEVAGALDRVLDGMADYMESVEIMRGKVKTAMRYPIFIGVFVSVMLVLILWWLVPTFAKIYTSMNADLPLPTQMLIYASDSVRNNYLAFIGAAIFLFISFRVLLTREKFQIAWEKQILNVPVFGPIMRKNIWATYCRTMSLLMSASTPILKATNIAGATVNNRYFTMKLEAIFSGLRKGDLLSEALDASGLFPVLVIQLVATGESSGKVDELLSKAAEFYEREIRNVVDSLSSIIEPILIVTLGGIIGGILFALYLPIFSVGQYVQ